MANSYQLYKNLLFNIIDDAHKQIKNIDNRFILEHQKKQAQEIIAKTKAQIESRLPELHQHKQQAKANLDKRLKELNTKPVQLDNARVIALQSVIKDLTMDQLVDLYQKRYADVGERELLRENINLKMDLMPANTTGFLSLATKLQHIDNTSVHLLSDEEKATREMIKNYEDVERYVDAVETVCKAKIAELENQQIQGVYGVKVTTAKHTIEQFDRTYNTNDEEESA